MLRRLALVCGTLLMVGGFIDATAPTSVAAAMTKITGQATYKCEGGNATFGPNAGTSGIRLSLSVPTSVQPGQRLTLTGVLSFELSAKDSATAQQLGITSSEMHSDTLSIVIEVGKSVVRVPANPWDTGPQPTANPIVLTAPISFHPFTVPSDAVGSMQVYLPYQDVVPNIVPHTKRQKVAETTVSINQTVAGPIKGYSGCWFPYSPRPSVGRIPVASSSRPAATGASAPSGQPTTSGQSHGSPSTKATAASTGTRNSPVGVPSGGEVVQAPTTAQSDITGQTAPDAQTYMPAAAVSRNDGVYVSTGLLVLGGFVICLGSLSYAALAHVRLRNMRKALER